MTLKNPIGTRQTFDDFPAGTVHTPHSGQRVRSGGTWSRGRKAQWHHLTVDESMIFIFETAQDAAEWAKAHAEKVLLSGFRYNREYSIHQYEANIYIKRVA
jgi:hypothetical protein